MPRTTRVIAPAALFLVAMTALVWGLSVGGGAAELPVADPGPVVRWGLPIAKLFVDLGASGTVGSLAIVVFALRAGTAAYHRALDIAAASAMLWTVATGVAAFLTFLSVYLQPIGFDDRFGQMLGRFLVEIEMGRMWLATLIISAVVTVLCFAVRNHTALLFVAVLAVAGLVPIAAMGHAGGAEDHNVAVPALWMHVVAAAVWLGGLLTVVLLRGQLKDRLVVVVSRYSTLALICFIVVAFSGYISAELRVGALDALATPYGLLVLVKVLALVALGVFGAWQRRAFIRRMERRAGGPREQRAFWGMVVAELAFMGLAFGAAVALGRTATPKTPFVPADAADPSPAELLTRRPLPPEPDAWTWITAWQPDPLLVTVCGFLLFFYLAGVVRLVRRGDRWPILRTLSWCAGVLLLFWVVNGAFAVYERYLFSMHMLGHMLLTMMIPLLLVPAAPITLALRAIARRADGTRGAREWIMLAVHSRYLAFLTNPVVAAVIFAGSLYVFYFTPVFRWAVTDHLGHYWMIVHFVGSGYLFVLALIGTDPIPYRAPYPVRLIVLMGAMAAHAFFGVAIMSSQGLLLADWYGAMGRTWGDPALVDQQTAGGIAWGLGEIPVLFVAVALALLWSRSDDREARRNDRQADRDGDAELAAWNAMLAEHAARDRAAGR